MIIDPLESSKNKIARAEKHFIELHREIDAFDDTQPYERVTEAHPEKPGHILEKVRMTKQIPASISDNIADIAISLRSALDNAAYAIAVAGGVKEPRNAAFPFAGNVAHMANAIGRAKDVPPQIQSLFCGFQPYKRGNDLLWALNEVANTDKHKIAIPIGQALMRYGVNVSGTGFFSMPNPHVWDRAKNEMILIELGPEATYNCDFQFRFFIAFHDIDIIDGHPVVEVLTKMGSIVERILVAIEAEARRLRIFK